MGQSENALRPMPIRESVLIGVIIAGLGVICFFFVRPLLEKAGLGEYAAYLFSLSGVFVVMLAWSLLAFLREGNNRTVSRFLQRSRLTHLEANWWAWSIGLGLLMFLVTISFSPVLGRLIASGIIPLPDTIPDYINPLKQQSIAVVKSQLVSQGIIPIIPVILALNILGEEIFWRGIVLPRQELQHGRNTFWIHGVIWALTHVFQYWLLVPILIGSVALAYVIQRTKCTWIGILAHALNNGIPFLIMAFV
jgi:membrane protease YdiL (CAAX protease family)